MTANIDETTVVGAGTARGYEDKKLNDTDTNQNIFLFIISGMLMQVSLTVRHAYTSPNLRAWKIESASVSFRWQ